MSDGHIQSPYTVTASRRLKPVCSMLQARHSNRSAVMPHCSTAPHTGSHEVQPQEVTFSSFELQLTNYSKRHFAALKHLADVIKALLN